MKANKAKKKAKLQRRARSLVDSMRQLLTTHAWKQAHRARRTARTPRSSRWHAEPLIFVMLIFTWCCGDSYVERFETARAFYVICHRRERRPGKTVNGFQKALARLPMRVLRSVASALRQRIAKLCQQRMTVDGWMPFGVDGSRLECPRSAELERHLGCSSKKHSAPMMWVTAMVHLRLGLLWSWWLGKGKASERHHAKCLLSTLPPGALLVADAGFHGFALAQSILDQGLSFLIRMSSSVTLLVEQLPSRRAREGIVWYWPTADRQAGSPPIQARLLRIRGKKKGRDVWLLTSVLDSKRLPVDVASKFYRWRWENEGLFRSYKRTLNKVKLMSRTVRLVHREAEGALLAMQLLLAQGTLALRPQAKRTSEAAVQMCSPRKVLLEIRKEIYELHRNRRRKAFSDRLQEACRERRQRTSAKETRRWPRPNKNKHKVPRPPNIRELNPAEKRTLIQLELGSAA